MGKKELENDHQYMTKENNGNFGKVNGEKKTGKQWKFNLGKNNLFKVEKNKIDKQVRKTMEN